MKLLIYEKLIAYKLIVTKGKFYKLKKKGTLANQWKREMYKTVLLSPPSAKADFLKTIKKSSFPWSKLTQLSEKVISVIYRSPRNPVNSILPCLSLGNGVVFPSADISTLLKPELYLFPLYDSSVYWYINFMNKL